MTQDNHRTRITRQNSFCDLGRAVLETEANAIRQLIPRLGDSFADACALILECQGRVVVTGMGKSGHVAGKLAATFASTGTPAFFVHPGEASHGDLGMIIPGDVVVALSNSGETQEINQLLPLIKRRGIGLIAITGNANSTLAAAASVHLDVGVEKEACPLGLAPTASTTASLAMGDALAIALLEARGFTAEDFALSHPGGRLGRRLLLRVADLMHTGSAVPRVNLRTPLADALLEITRKGLGMTAVTNATGQVEGIFTDGDLRRALDTAMDLHTATVEEVMTPGPRLISEVQLAVEAAALMDKHRINALLVTDAEGGLTGALNMHDLLRAGVL